MTPIPLTKFILLGQQRTGTNHLLSMLGAHPKVLAFGEVFSSARSIQWGSGIRENVANTLPPVNEALVAERDAAPLDFLHRHVFGSLSSDYSAAGFKIFYEHCRDEATAPIWKWLAESASIRVIHIKRRNILRTLLSKRLANATKVWHRLAEEGGHATDDAQPATIALSEADCREFFERTLVAEREADWTFRRHACLEIYYEDLEQDPAATLGAVQAFLGVRQFQAPVKFVKQQTLPLDVAITNYQELKAAFASHHKSIFFEA